MNRRQFLQCTFVSVVGGGAIGVATGLAYETADKFIPIEKDMERFDVDAPTAEAIRNNANRQTAITIGGVATSILSQVMRK